jgi:hypothetical protein
MRLFGYANSGLLRNETARCLCSRKGGLGVNAPGNVRLVAENLAKVRAIS